MKFFLCLIFLILLNFTLNAQNSIEVEPVKTTYNLKDSIFLKLKNKTRNTLNMRISIEKLVNYNWFIYKWETVVSDVYNNIYTIITMTPYIAPNSIQKRTINLHHAFEIYLKPPPKTNFHYDFSNIDNFRLKIYYNNDSDNVCTNAFNIIR